jgi:hypothetical protein
MQRSLMLSLAAGALALGLSFGAAQAVMPIPDAAPGANAGTEVTPVRSSSSYRCRLRYRWCLRRCRSIHHPVARQRCLRRCAFEYRICVR